MERKETLSVMQPYAFPYFGYFCLIESSDLIVFYDDVNFIKGGWINRNRILNNGNPELFNVFLSGASSFKQIKEIMLFDDDKKIESTLNKIKNAYRNAPYFYEVFPIIEKVFEFRQVSISDFAILSIQAVYDYLDLNLNSTISSVCSPHTKGLNKVERLVTMTKELGYKNYINVMGGKDLYNKEEFAQHGVNLYFNKPLLTPYDQKTDGDFHPYLSIIDVMMYCSKEQIINMIRNYETI